MFPKELIRIPKKWASSHYKIIYWNNLKKGGHFPAHEVPEDCFFLFFFFFFLIFIPDIDELSKFFDIIRNQAFLHLE